MEPDGGQVGSHAGEQVGAALPPNAEVVCFSCGYSLTGLSREGVCPECGVPISRSYEDDQLVHSAPEYLRKLHLGVTIILASVIGSLLIGFAVMGLTMASVGQAPLIAAVLSVLASIASAAGWWLFSEPDIKLEHHGGQGARRFIRISVLATISIAVINFVGTFVSDEFAAGGQQMFAGGTSVWAVLAIVMWVVGMAAWAVQFFASMLYLRWLAPRFPDWKLFKDAKRFMWLGPLLYTVGMVACGIGPLVALILYCAMLFTVRRQLNVTMDLQRERRVLSW